MIDVHGLLVLSMQNFVLLTAASTLLCAFFGIAAFRHLRRARWVEDTPTSRIRSAAQGLVELCGTCNAGNQPPLTSRLGGLPCLWYRFTVEQYRRSGKRSYWRMVDSGSSARPFVLRDDTGECWIDPEGAEVHPRQRRRWEGRSRWPDGQEQGFSLLGLVAGQRYRYTEEWFAEGDLLYALGWFASQGGGRDLVDESGLARRLITQWKNDYPQLLRRFDRDGDGRLDQQEWSNVQTAAAVAASQEARAVALVPVEHRLARPPHRGLPFVLSDHHEEDLSRRLRWKSRGSLAGMLACGAAATWLWTALA
jgi:hypothetical protein